MKVAYILAPAIVLSGRSNGIRSQVLTWISSLRANGHEVVQIDIWGNYDWKEFDIIHFFGSGGDWTLQFAETLIKHNSNLIFSPICDDTSMFKQKLKTYVGCDLLSIWSNPFIRRKAYKFFKGFCVRSDHEAKLISTIYGAKKELIYKVPLSYSLNIEQKFSLDNSLREPFCFHISTLYQPRKNVVKLVEAAKKYNFKLVLAGTTGTEIEFSPIKRAIGESSNIEVLGFITEEEKIDLYNKAKVFALPSVEEGVGIVALDAAVCGCEIVITNIAGPEEYYPDSMVYKVNPHSIDDIGIAINKALLSENQPELKQYIISNYSLDKITTDLVECYEKIIAT